MKGWKTALFALALTIVGGVQVFFETVTMDPTTQGYVLAGIGVVTAGLRAVTSTPIFNE